MDRAEARQPLDGASAPQPAAADKQRAPEEPTVDQDGHRALPAPGEPGQPPPERPRGRHEAQRRSVSGPARVAIAVVIAAVVFAGVLATWLISSAKEAPEQSSGTAAGTTAQAGPTSRPPGPSTFGNLIVNWSFEQDLNGWEVLGEADATREPQGRTSGSGALVRARGPEPGQVGLALPDAASAEKGQRYVASAYVRSTAPGQPVTVRVIGAGGQESSKETGATLPGLQWRRIIVDHTVATAGPLRLEIVAEEVPAGDALLVDEVIMRLG